VTKRSAPPAPVALTLDELVAKLSPAVGREKVQEAVSSAVATLGSFDADAVLNVLAGNPGVIGIAARFARSRGLSGAASPAPAVPPAPPSRRRIGVDEPDADSTIRWRSIVDLLSPSLGEEASENLVVAAMRRCSIEDDDLDRGQSLTLLETLASEPGLAGITARFAKARLILLFRQRAENSPRTTAGQNDR